MIDPQGPIGVAKAELDTPALLVDLEVMDANIARIMAECREHGVAWRPHSKVHKTPEIAHRLIAAGARGITCAKLGEAEVMAAAGIRDILIANQIVGTTKIRRLIDLTGAADPIVAVDSVANATALSDAASGQGKVLKVVIEVDVGMNRSGAEPGVSAAALASAISALPGLRFAGLMAWEGHAATIADPVEKQHAVADAIGRLTASADACRRAGQSVDIVSCGGSGTFPHCVRQYGVTEVQVGGAIFSDMHYRTNYHLDFPCALTMLATVTSRPTPTRIVLDAGNKTMSGDAALPQPIGLPAAAPIRLSAEHSRLELERPSETPRVGDPVELIVGYSDTTVHLHDEIIGIRDGRVASAWRIAGRGKIK